MGVPERCAVDNHSLSSTVPWSVDYGEASSLLTWSSSYYCSCGMTGWTDWISCVELIDRV